MRRHDGPVAAVETNYPAFPGSQTRSTVNLGCSAGCARFVEIALGRRAIHRRTPQSETVAARESPRARDHASTLSQIHNRKTLDLR